MERIWTDWSDHEQDVVDGLIEDLENDRCPACDGPLGFLGRLGRRVHFRCRDCGADCSATAE